MLKGCGTALITPFKNGAVDYDAFAALVDRQVAGGIDFLVPLGTTGETPCLTDDEKIRVLQIAKEHSNGLPVMAGVGTNCLEQTIANIQLLEPHGVDYFLVVVPYYNKPPQEGMYQYDWLSGSCCNSLIVLIHSLLRWLIVIWNNHEEVIHTVRLKKLNILDCMLQ